MFRYGCLNARRGSTFGTLALLGVVGVVVAGCTASSDTIVAGTFGPDEPVALSNLTVQDGRYLVSYELDLYIASQGGQVSLVCGVVDTTGRVAQLPGFVESVTSGVWHHLSASDTLELPDLTLGVRCYPDRQVTLQVVVRDVQLAATDAD